MKDLCPCYSCGQHRFFWLSALTWPSPGCLRHLGSKSMDGRYIFVPLSLCLSNKLEYMKTLLLRHNLKMNNIWKEKKNLLGPSCTKPVSLAHSFLRNDFATDSPSKKRGGEIRARMSRDDSRVLRNGLLFNYSADLEDERNPAPLQQAAQRGAGYVCTTLWNETQAPKLPSGKRHTCKVAASSLYLATRLHAPPGLV